MKTIDQIKKDCAFYAPCWVVIAETPYSQSIKVWATYELAKGWYTHVMDSMLMPCVIHIEEVQ